MTSFLHAIAPRPCGLPDTALICGRFDLACYTPDLFAILNIRCPDTLRTAADKRKADFLAGRAVAMAALRSLGEPATDLPIGPTRAPLWPPHLRGSISHARGHCAAIVTRLPKIDLGLDIEAIASGSALDAIRTTTMDAQERALIAGSPALATLVFSAKETLFKALHPTVQRHFGFDAARLMAAPTPETLRLRLTQTLHDTHREGAMFDIRHQIAADHVLTWLAVASP